MNNQLSQQQIDDYRQNGAIVLEDFLSPDELETWRDAVDEAVEARGKRKLAEKGKDWDSGDSYYDNVFIQRLNLWQDNEKVRALMLDERLGKMAAELEGVDGIRIWHDQALIKEPWGNPTAWHRDNPYWSFSSEHSISIWVALDDATFENGCLYFIPGSHRIKIEYGSTPIGENMRAFFKVHPEFAKIQPVAGPMKAGSCSFHNGLTVHGAGANMTPGYRRAMTCGYMPAGSTFNGVKNILSDEQVAALKVGDVIADDEQNPLIYSTASIS